MHRSSDLRMPPADVATPPAPPPRPVSGRARGVDHRWAALPWPALALAALSVATFVGFLVYPTYPNYDSYYSLLWGHEVLHGQLPSFDGYRTPTQHPLAVAFGAVLSLLGRGGVVWGLLVCAGLLRPEAWLLVGLYFLWMAWPLVRDRPAAGAVRRARLRIAVRYAVWTALAPVIWVATDWIVTGQPLFSLQHTSGLAEELGRTKGLAEVPDSMRRFFENLAKAPVIYAAVLGFAIALWMTPRRVLMPAALWLIGTGTFVLVGVAGLSVIDRYLLVPTLMVMLFAAVALGGWTMLRSGHWARRVWAVAAGLIVVYGAIFTATRVNFHQFDGELKLRGTSHRDLVELLDQRRIRDAVGAGCGPVSTPTHKLLPEVRWVLGGADRDAVLARADPAQAEREQRGVALFVVDRGALLRQSLVESTDDVFDNLPLGGFQRLAFTDYYSAYVRC